MVSPSVIEPDAALFRPRNYQTEMFEASLQQNVIVTMDTGSGKTHVCVARNFLSQISLT
ncbi:hypothetical protein BDV59DRAFT_140203 [Aspergillus ambiguus]|uniref:uncharacterized protein n=1 Tax=Aspergillus ambiguus TaxID=176160 RepID=UPI003CCDEC42